MHQHKYCHPNNLPIPGNNVLMWPEPFGRSWEREQFLEHLLLSLAFKPPHTLASIFLPRFLLMLLFMRHAFHWSWIVSYAPTSCMLSHTCPFTLSVPLECPSPVCVDPKPTHHSGPGSKIIFFSIFYHIHLYLAVTSPSLNSLGISPPSSCSTQSQAWLQAS